MAMNLTAALASGYSISIGQWTGYGWRGSLGIWLIIALLALLVVILELLFNKNTAKQQKTDVAKSDFNMFKSAQAWNISIFMGLQSLVYYCLVSWLPAVLGDYGMTGNAPGWVLFTIQIAMLPITFISTYYCEQNERSENNDCFRLYSYDGGCSDVCMAKIGLGIFHSNIVRIIKRIIV